MIQHSKTRRAVNKFAWAPITSNSLLDNNNLDDYLSQLMFQRGMKVDKVRCFASQ